jgi:CRISPR/Cas system endoribonuclease Cas6 (RAMP superfamily)
MKVEISNGELLDKISILELKLLKIEDKEKLVNIQKEFDTLNPLVVDLFEQYDGQLQNHYLELAKINGQLWDIEDWIRDCEREKRFDKEFVELARSVYITNDKRCEVKKIINLITSSGLVEEKSYKEY